MGLATRAKMTPRMGGRIRTIPKAVYCKRTPCSRRAKTPGAFSDAGRSKPEKEAAQEDRVYMREVVDHLGATSALSTPLLRPRSSPPLPMPKPVPPMLTPAANRPAIPATSNPLPSPPHSSLNIRPPDNHIRRHLHHKRPTLDRPNKPTRHPPPKHHPDASPRPNRHQLHLRLPLLVDPLLAAALLRLCREPRPPATITSAGAVLRVEGRRLGVLGGGRCGTFCQVDEHGRAQRGDGVIDIEDAAARVRGHVADGVDSRGRGRRAQRLRVRGDVAALVQPGFGQELGVGRRARRVQVHVDAPRGAVAERQRRRFVGFSATGLRRRHFDVVVHDFESLRLQLLFGGLADRGAQTRQ